MDTEKTADVTGPVAVQEGSAGRAPVEGGPVEGGPGRPVTRRWAAVRTAALILFPLALLGAAFRIGRLVRPGADDWCFLPVVRDEGASGMIAKFYLHDNGRVANALLVVAYGAFGVPGQQWYALVSGVVVVGVLRALVLAVLGRAGLSAPRGVPLLVAATASAVFLLATPDTYKTFYWPASSVSHTVSPVLACAAVIPLLRARSSRGRALASVVALAAGVFIGTLSEETSVVACVVLCAVLLLSFRTVPGPVPGPGPGPVRTRVWCAAAFAGVVIGAAVLYFSPGAHARHERFGADAGSMFGAEQLGAALRAFGEILATVLTTWQYAGALAVGVLLGLSVRGDGQGPDGPRVRGPLLPVGVGVLAFLVSGCLCTVVTYPVFGPGVVTAARVWGDFLLVYVLLLTGVGALLGRELRARRWRTRTATAVAASAVSVLTCVGLAVPLFRLGTEMQVRAERWDRQDRSLRDGAARGARVLPYTPVPVGRMLEPFAGHGRRTWPAQCVAEYYHLEKVTYSTRLP
ncbi:DUF6056 family protein [Streptomyces sp. NPDC047917]|uniref:DUF6056 family protein n=1 Tax=Streptomyces sp. NPDC047917 TaxID=3365491 RepID=UPI00371BCD8E